MVYRAVLSETAEGDAGQISDWIIERAPSRGLEWFGELVDSLYSLEQLPYRCPLAREAAQARREIECLLFGSRKHAYRILYEVNEASQTVRVLQIRRGSFCSAFLTASLVIGFAAVGTSVGDSVAVELVVLQFRGIGINLGWTRRKHSWMGVF